MLPITFYYDLGSPYAYLTAERLEIVCGQGVTWQPILLGGVFAANGRSSWALAGDESRRRGIEEVERRAQKYGLPELRWPDPWPSNYLFAMRAATAADRAGVGRPFTERAFRAAFQRGLDLSKPEIVLEIGEEAGLEQDRLKQAIEDPDVKLALREATDAAHALGVVGVPTLAVGRELFWGDDRVEDAARAAGASADDA